MKGRQGGTPPALGVRERTAGEEAYTHAGREARWQAGQYGSAEGSPATCSRVRFPVLLQRCSRFLAESDFGIFGRRPLEKIAVLTA
jgi:hypothetical protein